MPKKAIDARKDKDVVSSSAKKVEELKDEVPNTNFDDINSKSCDDVLLMIENLIEDEENDIRLLKEITECKEERVRSLKKLKRDILVRMGRVVAKSYILYEFTTKSGETAYSIDYDEAIRLADDPCNILVHSATWDGKEKKWEF